MALDENRFEVIEDKPIDGRFELVDDKTPDLSKVGRDPYDIYKLQEAQAVNREDYPITVPPSLNPNYDFNRATGYGGPITATLGLAADALGKGIVKIADIPTRISNIGKTPESPGYRETLEEREDRGPIFKFPRVETKDLKGVPAAVAGVENTLLGTAESMLGRPSSALTLPLLGAEGGVSRIAGGIYGLNAAAQLPNEVQNAVDVYNDPNATTAEKTEAIANPVVQGALAYGMMRHAAGPREAVPAPTLQGPYALGSMLKMPEGAEAPLQVERFEPLDTQSGSPLSPQELIARQSRTPTPPEAPEPEIKTWNLDETEGAQNAIETGKQPESNQPEHSGDASQRPPAQASGGGSVEQRAEAPQSNEPIARAGDARGGVDEKAPQIDLDFVSKLSPEEFFKHSQEWASRAMMDQTRETPGPQRLAEEAAKSNPDLEAWQKASDAATTEAHRIRDEVKKDPSKMMERQREMMGAGQKVQFFNEGIKAIKQMESEKATGKTPEFVGMGGAVPSEFNPEGNTAREVYGIAHEVREARARAGQVDEVERGEGISTPASIARGRELLKGGTNPEQVLKDFESTKRFSSDDMAVVRAHGEQLARDAHATEIKFGTNSPEYEVAYKKLSEWDKRSKVMQTEWNKSGMAQQGQTDIDTGSYTGIRRELESSTGKPITPEQADKAKGLSDKVNKAADATEAAKNELFDQLDRESGDAKTMTQAERRALDAANKTVREAAIRRAQAENKARVAKTAEEGKAARAEMEKEQKSLDLATNKAREAATRLADAENKQRVAEAAKAEDDTQAKAAQRALDAANKTVRDAAEKLAKSENDARVAKSAKEKKAAQEAAKRDKKALDAANKVVRDAAARAAEMARKQLGLSLSERAWQKAREYIDKGVTNFDDIRNKLATDLGMPVEKVTAALAKTKRAKFLTDELWKRQQEYRKLDSQAKRWIAEQQTPGLVRALRAVPNLAFSLKVFGHGTVALGTHAPMVAFQPRFWKAYANDFVKMYRMVGSRAFYENQMQDLMRRPNYTTARRAGLINDPYQYEDYNSPQITKWMGPLANTGDRGYSVLKILRQDMFDQMWNKLPKTTQIPEVASALADGINHATGVVRSKAPPGSNVVLFAPRLAASRAAWLVADPLRAARAFLDWKNASEGERQFAINQVKEKAWVVGTMLGLLAANEGILEASGSNQRVNLTDPMKRDWLKFKAGGLNIGYGNAMLSMARLPARLYRIRESDGGKLKNLVYPDEDTYSVLGEYGRSQLSPFASLALNLWLKSDWQNRPLPNSDRPVPKRLAARGVGPYTWPEFWTEQVLPIPAEEAAREVWKNGLGMSEEQIKEARKALATISIMAATGSRVEEDTDTVGPQNH